MRRILLGSILFSWIAFLVAVVTRGWGAAGHGLLYEMQAVLIDVPGLAGDFAVGRAILTAIIVVTLTAVLWALMIAVATDEEERRERVLSLGAAFAWVLLAAGFGMLAATFIGVPQAVPLFLAIKLSTLVTLLAAGGVELAWTTTRAESLPVIEPRDSAGHLARQMATFSARLAAMGTPANDYREPR